MAAVVEGEVLEGEKRRGDEDDLRRGEDEGGVRRGVGDDVFAAFLQGFRDEGAAVVGFAREGEEH